MQLFSNYVSTEYPVASTGIAGYRHARGHLHGPLVAGSLGSRLYIGYWDKTDR